MADNQGRKQKNRKGREWRGEVLWNLAKLKPEQLDVLAVSGSDTDMLKAPPPFLCPPFLLPFPVSIHPTPLLPSLLDGTYVHPSVSPSFPLAQLLPQSLNRLCAGCRRCVAYCHKTT